MAREQKPLLWHPCYGEDDLDWVLSHPTPGLSSMFKDTFDDYLPIGFLQSRLAS